MTYDDMAVTGLIYNCSFKDWSFKNELLLCIPAQSRWQENYARHTK